MPLPTRAAHDDVTLYNPAFIAASSANAHEVHDLTSVVVTLTVTLTVTTRTPDARWIRCCRDREGRTQRRGHGLDRRREHPYRASDDLTAVHVALELLDHLSELLRLGWRRRR